MVLPRGASCCSGSPSAWKVLPRTAQPARRQCPAAHNSQQRVPPPPRAARRVVRRRPPAVAEVVGQPACVGCGRRQPGFLCKCEARYCGAACQKVCVQQGLCAARAPGPGSGREIPGCCVGATAAAGPGVVDRRRRVEGVGGFYGGDAAGRRRGGAAGSLGVGPCHAPRPTSLPFAPTVAQAIGMCLAWGRGSARPGWGAPVRVAGGRPGWGGLALVISLPGEGAPWEGRGEWKAALKLGDTARARLRVSRVRACVWGNRRSGWIRLELRVSLRCSARVAYPPPLLLTLPPDPHPLLQSPPRSQPGSS
jgi:hypothetical protein